jgi:Periplasmic binding protein
LRRFGWLGVLLVIVLAFSACSSGKKIGGGLTTSSTSPVSETTSDVCKTTTLTGSEIGVTPKTITVSVIADTGSQLRPGLFQGSVDAVQAWAKYINDKGGLACRQVVVKALDSKLSGDDAKNSVTTACGNSLAMVGTTALFLDNMSAAEQCKDKAGKPTGILDMAVLQTYAAQQCSRVSFAALPSSASCPYSADGGVRTFKVSTVTIDYYLNKYGKGTLHGVYLVPNDLPSTISATTPQFYADVKEGIAEDAQVGISALATQSGYTPVVQTIKNKKSTYVRDGADYVSTVFLRKEAQVQGVNTVKVWDCSLQCYDPKLIATGGSAVENQYAWLSFLPFEDKGHNDELDNFLKYDTKPDGFGVQAWVAGEAFAAAVNAVVAKSGPNGLTRASVLEAMKGVNNFDAGGLISPTNIGQRQGSSCLIGMQVQGGKFVRVDPVEPGKFDCNGRVITFSIDPVKAYHG